jgi:hypothetical protein
MLKEGATESLRMGRDVGDSAVSVWDND